MRSADLLVLLFSSVLTVTTVAQPSEELQKFPHLADVANFYVLLPPKRAGHSSFVGMRGKKSDNEDFSDPMDEMGKRAAFMGMRGKKDFSEIKRAGFVGMRGKKALEEENEENNLFVSPDAEPWFGKRAGFVGMRGKKEEGNYMGNALLHGYGYLPKARRGGSGSSGSSSGFVGMRG